MTERDAYLFGEIQQVLDLEESGRRGAQKRTELGSRLSSEEGTKIVRLLDKTDEYVKDLRKMQEIFSVGKKRHTHSLSDFWDESRIRDFNELLDITHGDYADREHLKACEVRKTKAGIISYEQEFMKFARKLSYGTIALTTASGLAIDYFLPDTRPFASLMLGSIGLIVASVAHLSTLCVNYRENIFRKYANEIEQRAGVVKKELLDRQVRQSKLTGEK